MPDEKLTIATPDGNFTALVRRPEGRPQAPAVIVIQEIFGLNHTIREVADRMAEAGFCAVAPDLFWRFEPDIVLDDRDPEDAKRAFDLFPKFDVDKGVDDIRATIDAVRGMAGVNGKVGAVGFCLGGLLAFLTATRSDADAVVGYYGVNIDAHTSEAEELHHPLMLHIAGDDAFVPSEAQETIGRELGANTQITLHRYPGRDHAFARRDGENYHAADAAVADQRTLDFLIEHLGGMS